MIDKVKIKNYQSNIDSKLTFSKGVNLIIGESDAGKSAIFRAIKWVLTNEPLGKSFITWDSDGAETSLLIEDTLITRLRTAKLNVYTDSNGNKLSAGHGVPDEIRTFLNIRSDINIQQQIGQPFLLQKSPGEIAQFFNSIIGISDIDKSTKHIKTNITELNTTIKTLTKDQERIEEKLKSYAYIEEAEKDIQQIEHLQKIKYTKQKEINYVAEILNDIDDSNQKLKDLTGKENALPVLDEIQKSVDSLVSNKNKIDNLRSLLDKIKTVETTYLIKKKQAKKLMTEYNKTFPDICPLCDRVGRTS